MRMSGGTYLGIVTHFVFWFWDEMARSSSSNAPDFFNFFTKLFTAFSHHLSSASLPFFQPNKRFTTGGVNDGSITFITQLSTAHISLLFRDTCKDCLETRVNFTWNYCYSTAILFFDSPRLITAVCGQISGNTRTSLFFGDTRFSSFVSHMQNCVSRCLPLTHASLKIIAHRRRMVWAAGVLI